MHERTAERTRLQIQRAIPHAVEAPPPPIIAAAMTAVAALVAGERRAPVSCDLDMTGLPEFDRRVYAQARTIPAGETMTYGQIAAALGEEPMRARDVGQALARNPFA